MQKMYIPKEKLLEYEKETGFVSYYTLVKRYIDDMVLCNNIINIDDSIFENVKVGKLKYDDDIFQYFIISINEWDLESLQRDYKNELIISYSDLLECYILLVDHFGTSWDYVLTNIKHTQTLK